MNTENLWWSAVDALPKESELVTVEEKLAYAQILATLSVSQELSLLNTGESTLGAALVQLAPEEASGGLPTKVR